MQIYFYCLLLQQGRRAQTLLDGFDFYFDLFEWRDTENQQ